MKSFIISSILNEEFGITRKIAKSLSSNTRLVNRDLYHAFVTLIQKLKNDIKDKLLIKRIEEKDNSSDFIDLNDFSKQDKKGILTLCEFIDKTLNSNMLFSQMLGIEEVEKKLLMAKIKI